MTDEKIALRIKEKTRLTKYAPGVDPKDPKSQPYEVVETEREMSPEETAMVISMIKGMHLAEIKKLQAEIATLEKQKKALSAGEPDKLKR